MIGRTLRRADQFCVARWDPERGRFRLLEPLSVLSARRVARLPDASRDAHVAHLERVRQRLEQSYLAPGDGSDLMPGHVPWGTVEIALRHLDAMKRRAVEAPAAEASL